MGLRKGTVIVLENAEQGKREFTEQHAKNLLKAKYNTGLWVLPENSKYKFENGEFHRTSISRTNQNPEKPE